MFSQKEVNRIFSHIPVKTLRWWGQRGLYGWVNEFSDGRGIHREYELANLYQIGIVEELSSLNLPSTVINVNIMKKHFRSGKRMSAPTILEQPERVDENKWPLVNVAEQMDKILIIIKVLSGTVSQPGKRETPSYSWLSILAQYQESKDSQYQESKDLLVALLRRYDAKTIIVIDLAKIKESVDLLISMA